MNRDLPLFPTGLFLISLIACIVIYMQRVDTFEVPVVGQIFEQSGDVKFLFKNEVLKLHEEETVLSFSSYGINNHVGQLGVAENGTIFANTKGQSTSLLKKWQIFQRKGEGAVKESSRSLLKCTQAKECLPWGDDVLQFDRAWSMFEVDSDQFVINDTSRHQIHLVDKNGKVLDTLEDFFFPNHIFRYQGSSWLVNTNTNSFIELDIRDGVLKRSGKSINVKQFKGLPKGYRFPSIAYSNDEESIVTLVHPRTMNRGKVFWLTDGDAIQEFEHLNDITAIFLNKDTLYAADYETHTIWSKNLVTGQQSKVVNNNYQQALGRIKETADAAWEQYIIDALIWLGFGLLALIFAIVKSTPPKTIKTDVSSGEKEIFQANGEIHWVELHARQLRYIGLVKRTPTISAIIAIPCIVLAISAMIFSSELIGAYLPTLYFLAWLFLTLLIIVVIQKIFLGKNLEKLTQKLGWDGEFIYLRNIHRQTKALPEEVYYSGLRLYSNGVSVPIQFGSNHVFEKHSFETLISPTLDVNNKLTSWGLMKHQMKNGSSEMVVGSIFIVILISFFIGLQIFIRV